MTQTPPSKTLAAILSSGRPIYSLAIIGMGVETIVCAHRFVNLYPPNHIPQFKVTPVLPWLPPFPWLDYLFGAIVIILALGLFFRSTSRACALSLGTLLFFCALIIDVPRNIIVPADMGLRTLVFEPLSIACIAWLLPGRNAIPNFLDHLARYVLALALIAFGVDHFLGLAFIGSLIPRWIPWHAFWIAFFGAAFIATGISLAFNILMRWSTACLGLMFMIWVLTLHLPTVLGIDVLPGPKRNLADLWSSFLIAVSLWGGFCALARSLKPRRFSGRAVTVPPAAASSLV